MRKTIATDNHGTGTVGDSLHLMHKHEEERKGERDRDRTEAYRDRQRQRFTETDRDRGIETKIQQLTDKDRDREIVRVPTGSGTTFKPQKPISNDIPPSRSPLSQNIHQFWTFCSNK